MQSVATLSTVAPHKMPEKAPKKYTGYSTKVLTKAPVILSKHLGALKNANNCSKNKNTFYLQTSGTS
jgi:hypothetical protein